jgi:hypothetical protein
MSEKEYRKLNREINMSDLYPELSSEQQGEAEYRLLRYLVVVKRIFERISFENPELLTELERRVMLRKKRTSNFNDSHRYH